MFFINSLCVLTSLASLLPSNGMYSMSTLQALIDDKLQVTGVVLVHETILWDGSQRWTP